MLEHLPATHKHLELPELPEILKGYRSTIEGLVRPAWLLRANDVDAKQVSRGQSHIGGSRPFMPKELGWPKCPKCEHLQSFVWQLNFAELPETENVRDKGLFQFFFCWACFPFSSVDKQNLHTLEKVLKVDTLKPEYVEKPYGTTEVMCRWFANFESREIEFTRQSEEGQTERISTLKSLALEPFLSLPHPFDEDLFIIPNSEEYEAYWDAFGPHYNSDTISQLGGYPSWIQSGLYPVRSNTSQRGQFVAAIGSDDTDLLWGDTGFCYFFDAGECGGLTQPFIFQDTM